MEFGILIGIIVVGLGLYMWNTRKREEVSTKTESEPAPYKVEPQVAEVPKAEPAKCGCGRSPTGFCVGLHKLTTEEWSVHADNPNRVVVTAPEAKPAKPARAAKGTKAVVKKAGAKKPRNAKA